MRQDLAELCPSRNVTYCVEYNINGCPHTCFYAKIQDLAQETRGVDTRERISQLEHLTPQQFAQVRLQL